MDENLLKKKDKESQFDYKARLLKYKLEDKEDIDWSEIVKLLDLNCSADHLRKTAYGFLEAYNYLIENPVKVCDVSEDITSEIKDKKEELKQIKKEYDGFNKEIKKMEAQEERRLKVVELGDFYTITSKTRELKVPKNKVRLIKQLYCDDNGLEINELCRKTGMSRRDFMLIKSAFNIVHNDVPYLDEELDGDIDNLVNNTLERKKNNYFLKLQEKELEEAKKELNEYRQKDYLYNKILDKINEIEINPTHYNVTINQNVPYREGLLDIADLHLGEKFKNYWNEFNVEIARDRFKQLTMETIQTCAELGVKNVLHVSDLGDNISGIIHDTLTKEAELDIDEQVKLAVELIGTMLIEFSLVFNEVRYADVVGNHGRIIQSKDKCSENENFEYLINWGLKLMLQKYDNIIFEDNKIDDGIIIKDICGVKIFETHGHEDKFAKIASNLSMMIEKPNEIHTAHLHTNKSIEEHEVEVLLTRSFIGTNTYAKGIRATSKAGQRLFIYEEGKRKYINDIILN